MINQVLKKHKKHLPLVLLIVFFIAEVVFFIIYHNTWYDEANYLYNGWATYEFGWMPYRDVWTRVTPLIYYIYGLPQYLFGPGFYIGRITSAVIFILSVILMYQIAKRIGGRIAGILSLVFIAFTPYLVRIYITGTAYSIAVFFIMASFWSLLFIKDKYKVIFSLLFISLAVLIRQNLAPILVVFFLYWLIDKNKINKVLSFIIPLLTISAFLLPFIIICPVVFFRDIISGIMPDRSYLVMATLKDYSFGQSFYTMFRRIIDFNQEFFGIVLLNILIIISLVLKTTRQKFKKLFVSSEIKFIYLLIISSIVLFAAHFLIPISPGFVIYSLYFMPLLILVIAIVAGKIISIINLPLKTMVIIFVLAVIFMGLASIRYKELHDHFPSFSVHTETDLSKINRAAKIIKKYFNKDDLIFTLDESHLPLAAGVRIPPALSARFELLINGTFKPNDQGRYWNSDTVETWFEGIDGAILQKGRWQAWLNAANQYQAIDLINKGLKERCQLVEEIPQAYPEKYYFDPEGIALVYTCNK